MAVPRTPEGSWSSPGRPKGLPGPSLAAKGSQAGRLALPDPSPYPMPHTHPMATGYPPPMATGYPPPWPPTPVPLATHAVSPLAGPSLLTRRVCTSTSCRNCTFRHCTSREAGCAIWRKLAKPEPTNLQMPICPRIALKPEPTN